MLRVFVNAAARRIFKEKKRSKCRAKKKMQQARLCILGNALFCLPFCHPLFVAVAHKT
jgi:hypothetical protein